MKEESSTTNAILVVLLVIVVGFVVWYVMDHRAADDNKGSIEIKLPGGSDDSNK